MRVEASPSKGKVLIVSTIATTVKAFLLPNVRILREQGYEVEIAANFRPEINGGNRSEEFEKIFADAGAASHQIDFTRSPKDISSHKLAYKQLVSLLRNGDYAFVHTNTPIASTLCRKACHVTGTRCIYTAHGFHFYDGAPLVNWLLWYPIEKHMSRYTDVLITINHEDYERARTKFHAKKTVYIPGVGVDLSRFRPVKLTGEKRRELGLGNDDFVMLNVGELSPRKNQAVAVEALALLPDNVHLVICGQGPDHEALVQLAESLGVANRLHLLGYRSDIAEIIAASDAFVFPSLQEGLPVAVMEAMACGLPVVASKIRGIDPDLIVDHESGLVLPETTPENIGHAVKELMSDPELGKWLAATAVNSIQKFGLEDVLAQESKVYAGGGCRMLTRAKLGLAPDDFAVLAVGELNANKNHRVLVEAMAELPENVKLFIAGVGTLHDELLAFAARLGVSDRVTLLGYRSDIPALLNACDLFCMPSYREGLPVSLIEAAASGTPCLASNIRGCGDVLDDPECLVAQGSAATWAQVISLLYSDKSKRDTMGNHLYSRATCFGQKRVTEELEGIYRSLGGDAA